MRQIDHTAERALDADEDDVPDARCSSFRRDVWSPVVATFSFLLVFAASAVPIPLYAHYQTTVGLTDTDVAMTMLTYLLGVIATLFFFGRLSDALGRKSLVIASLILAALGCGMFMTAGHASAILFARFVQGVSCGLTMSATSAYLIEAAAFRFNLLGMSMASCGSLLGIMIGSIAIGIFSGASSEFSAMYLVCIVLSCAAAAGMLGATETKRIKVPLKTVLKPAALIPRSLGKAFPIAACAYTATWGVGTYFQSFSSPLAVGSFGMHEPLAAALVLSAAMAPCALGGTIVVRMGPARAMRSGSFLFIGSCIGMCATLFFGSYVLFLLFEILFSLSMGMCLSVSLHWLLLASNGESSASVVSAINLAGYISASILNALMGVLVNITSLLGVLAFLGIVGAIATIPCIVYANKRL